MSLSEALVGFVGAEPAAAARQVMRLSVLDWAACGIAGADEGGFAGFAASQRGPGACGFFGGGGAGAATAALVNGTLSHALDFDDTHFGHIGHPSVAVMPAALAVGQATNARLSNVIDAGLIGAEASVAVGLWLGRGHYQVGYHQTATAGSFGATLAAGRLLGLGAAEMRHALGLASTMASGLKSQFGTMGKPLNAGLAARTGVEAGLWAQAGMTSAEDGLEGALGFGATHHGAGHAVSLPGDVWRMESVSHKFHACCHGLHAAIEAALQVPDLAGAGLIEVYTHPRWLSVCNIDAPQTGLAAKFSYRQVLAMVAHGLSTAELQNYSDEMAQRVDLAAYRSRVEVIGDDTLSEMQARVVVDGVTFAHDLEEPLSLDARARRIKEKARTLAGERADRIWQAITADDLPEFLSAAQLDMS